MEGTRIIKRVKKRTAISRTPAPLLVSVPLLLRNMKKRKAKAKRTRIARRVKTEEKPTETSPTAASLLYVVCYFVELSSYSIYKIDLNIAAPPLQLNPLIKLDLAPPVEMAVSILNSKLYLFGNMLIDDDVEGFTWSDEMFIYDDITVVHPKTHPSLPMTSFRKGPPMLAQKFSPAAVILDGKICVFSTWFYHPSDSRGVPSFLPNFEVFDPCDESWSPLPEPPFVSDPSYVIPNPFYTNTSVAHLFIGSWAYDNSLSVLFIYTNYDGIYSLDFNNSVWNTIQSPYGYPTDPDIIGQGIVTDDDAQDKRFWISSSLACRLTQRGPFFFDSEGDRELLCNPGEIDAVSLIHHDRFVTARVGFHGIKKLSHVHRDGSYPYLQLRVYDYRKGTKSPFAKVRSYTHLLSEQKVTRASTVGCFPASL